jgi:ABC-type phosphate transport system auxiliary subunit
MSRIRRSTYDTLSDAAREIIDRGLEQGLTEEEIRELVRAETGETISRSALNRYKNNRWLVTRERIREQQERARLIAEALRANPTDDLIAAIEQYLQAVFIQDIQNDAVNPVAKGQLMARLAELRLKKERIDLDGKRAALEKERIELERERLELQRRLSMLPGAVKTWGLILDYFAEKDKEILARLQEHSDEIAARLEEYFEGQRESSGSSGTVSAGS